MMEEMVTEVILKTTHGNTHLPESFYRKNLLVYYSFSSLEYTQLTGIQKYTKFYAIQTPLQEHSQYIKHSKK